MVNKRRRTQIKSRPRAALLSLLLIPTWCLCDGLAHVQNTTPDGVGLFWSASQAVLNLRLGCPPNNPLTEWGPCWDTAAQDAAAQWNAVGAQFKFRIQSPSRPTSVACDGSAVDGISTVVWADTHCGMAWDDTTLAVTGTWYSRRGELLDGDVFFNANRDWSTYSGPWRFSAIDFHRVALHEFGHILGLGHPDDHGQSVKAIMNSKTSNIDRLQADDIRGIRAIYGGAPGDVLGDPDYCVTNVCGLGDGDCDPGQCDEGVCVNDVGARYGLPAHYDVCEASPSRPDPDYCVTNVCGLGDGDCDPGQCDEGVCVNDVGARYGLPAHYDVCEASPSRPDPDYCVTNVCGLGDGDCDPGQCDEGVCVNDVGARYGLPAHYDVCEASSSRPDPDYCVTNVCGLGDGDCDPGQCDEGVCVNDVGARYGLPAHYDVCEASSSRPDPDYCVTNVCGLGDGDCDPGQCDEGVCVNDVGARYGLPAHYDVCEASSSRPDPDYCVTNVCGLGDGDCDPGQCDEGVCVNDVGARYGLPAHYDVCEASPSRPDPDYCVTNVCGLGDGDCDPGQCDEGVCVNDVGARYGLPAHYDVCEASSSRPDPDYCVTNVCGLGDGDCDPGQCDEGVCVNDVGARYGLPAHYDVCEAR